MTDFESLTPQALRARGSQKWNRFDASILPMWIAEADFPTAPAIVEAVQRCVADEAFGYAEIDRRVPEAFAAFASRRLNMSINPEWTTVIRDVLAGVELAIECFAPAGTPVVVPTPSYMPFLSIPGMIGRELVQVPLVEAPGATTVAERWALDLAGIERAFAAGARSIIFCQPYNPVGKVFTAPEMNALAELAARHDAWVISDEIHAPLTMPGVRHLAFSEAGELAASRCITVTSASKTFTLPGLPCATLTLHTEQNARHFDRTAPHGHVYGATTLGIEANIAAFTHCDEWLDGAVAQISKNSSRLKAWLDHNLPEVGYLPGDGTYFAWLDWRGLGIDGDVAEWLKERGRIWMNSGAAFGAPGVGFTRMNLATTSAILDDGMQRLKTAVESR